MANILTSDLHLGHKLCAIMRGYFDDNPLVAKFIEETKNSEKHNELYRLTSHYVSDLIKNFQISYEEVKERISRMDEDLIANHNSIVGPTDTVWYLGDMGFYKTVEEFDNVFGRFNGKVKNLIVGNHDDKSVLKSKHWNRIEQLYTLKDNNRNFILCHYPLATWNKAHYGSFQIHGHCHGSYRLTTQQADAGVDSNNLFPNILEELVEKMNKAEKFMIPDYHGAV